MNHDDLQSIIKDTVDHAQPRTIRLQTPHEKTTSNLTQPVYLGTHEGDRAETTRIQPRRDNLNDVYAQLAYDNERDAITINPTEQLIMIRHGTTAKRNAHSITDLRPSDDKTVALTTGQTRHAMQNRHSHLLKEGTTRIAHGTTYQHLLGISNNDAYQRTTLLNDAPYQTRNASEQPGVDAIKAYHRLPFKPHTN